MWWQFAYFGESIDDNSLYLISGEIFREAFDIEVISLIFFLSVGLEGFYNERSVIVWDAFWVELLET